MFRKLIILVAAPALAAAQALTQAGDTIPRRGAAAADTAFHVISLQEALHLTQQNNVAAIQAQGHAIGAATGKDKRRQIDPIHGKALGPKLFLQALWRLAQMALRETAAMTQLLSEVIYVLILTELYRLLIFYLRELRISVALAVEVAHSGARLATGHPNCASRSAMCPSARRPVFSPKQGPT